MEISIFSLYCHRETYQDYQQIPQGLQNYDFQSHFSALKVSGIFLIFFYEKYYIRRPTCIRRNVLKMLIFKELYFLKMWPIFVSSVHKLGRSDDDVI